MTPVTVLAAEADLSVWEQLLEVIVVGAISGVGLSIAFALLVRGVTHAGTARRDPEAEAWLPNVLLATVAGIICLGAVAFAIYEMVSG